LIDLVNKINFIGFNEFSRYCHSLHIKVKVATGRTFLGIMTTQLSNRNVIYSQLYITKTKNEVDVI